MTAPATLAELAVDLASFHNVDPALVYADLRAVVILGDRDRAARYGITLPAPERSTVATRTAECYQQTVEMHGDFGPSRDDLARRVERGGS